MTEDRKYPSESTSPIEESLALSLRSPTCSNDSIEKKGWSWGWKSNRLSTKPLTSSTWAVERGVKVKLMSFFSNAYDKAKPILNRYYITKKQLFALSLLAICGIAPFAGFGHWTRGWSNELQRQDVPFATIWYNKILPCGGDFAGNPQNTTVKGIENLFVLDQTFGKMSFSQVKTIDIAWDVLVGRGVQLLAWWVAYSVFSDALLRVIERHPASFRIFQRIASEGPSLLSIWTLIREVWVAKSKRTRALFFYIFLSTIYILWIPLLLSAMTGYDSSTVSWVSLDDDNNKIVPSSSLEESWVISGAKNETFDHPVCRTYREQSDMLNLQFLQKMYCDCRFPNGTMYRADGIGYRNYDNCTTKYPGNTQTFKPYRTTSLPGTGYCNSTFDVTINGKTYDASDLDGNYGYCYNSVGYLGSALRSRSRCLPDTINPTYQWGFSTMMSGLFIIFHFIWCVTMYVVWQDAQFNSSLVKSGYVMTPVLAAFAMAKAAKRKTGLNEKQLLRTNTKELDQDLYGSRKAKGTTIEYNFFVCDAEQDGGEDERVVRKRRVQLKDEPGSSEVTLS